jgi:ABC-type polysaccharide/polyol phosphate export permease
LIREQFEYRELLVAVTRRDLVVRYKQSFIGIGWALFVPLITMAIFSVIFTRVVRLDTGLPYPVFAYAGLLPWTMFASSLRFATTSLTGNTTLVTKVYFPREILPFSAILVSLVDFAIASLVLAALMVHYGIGVSWALLFLPVVILVQVVFTAGVGLLLAMGNLFYRDVRYVSDVGITLWMFSTSVVYPIDRIGGRLGAILTLNPMTPIIDAYRSVLLDGKLPDGVPFGLAAVTAFLILAIGWVVFHRAECRFAESI